MSLADAEQGDDGTDGYVRVADMRGSDEEEPAYQTLDLEQTDGYDRVQPAVYDNAYIPAQELPDLDADGNVVTEDSNTNHYAEHDA